MSWKYGNYVFNIDPSDSEESIELIGDNIVTSSGRPIIQPTTYKTTRSISSIFYQPSTRKIYIKNISHNNIVSLDYINEEYYLALSDGRIVITNRNFKNDFFITPTIESDIRGITFDSVTIWLLTQLDNISHKLYAISPVDGIIEKEYIYNGYVSGLVYLGEYPYGLLYIQNSDGVINEINPTDGSLLNTYSFLKSLGSNFMGATRFKNYYITTYNNQNIVFTNFNEVIDQEKINSDVIKDLVSIYNNNYLIITNTYDHYRINSVNLDLYELEQEIKKGQITLEDYFGKQEKVSIQQYNYQRINELYKAYSVRLVVSKVS